jgi:hypothetical protein
MIPLSPTLPNFLFVRPPVDVPAAKLPYLSKATAPTVPIFALFSMLTTSYYHYYAIKNLSNLVNFTHKICFINTGLGGKLLNLL